MKRNILSLLIITALVFTAPSIVLAQTTNNNQAGVSNMPKNPMTLVHAYKPFGVNSQTGMTSNINAVRARVDNWTTNQQMKLVCVEAMKSSGGGNHLGCLSTNLMSKGSMQGDWAREFDTPLNSLSSGSYTMMYNYQDDQGRWFPVTDLNGDSVSTTVTK